MRGDMLRGHLDVLLLGVISAGPAHGYAIIEALRDRSDGAFDLPAGTVYPALQRLERSGLITSTWSDATGRRRRTYRITAKGRKQMATRRREVERFVESFNRIFEEGPWPEPA